MGRVNPLPPPITGAVVRFTVITQSQGQFCMNTWDYMGATFPTSRSADLPLITFQFETNMRPAYLAVLPSTTLWIGVVASWLDTSTFRSIELNTPGSGSLVVTQVPLEMAVIIKKFSELRGQHGLGRVYIPAIPITLTTPATNPNRINNAGLALYNAIGNAYQVDLNGDDPVIYHACISMRPEPPATVVTLAETVDGTQAQPLMGTIRRRREGRGI